MKEKYRLAAISYFKDGASHLLTLFLLGLAIVIWIALVVLFLFLLYMVLKRLSISVDLSAEILAGAFMCLICLPLFISMVLGMSEEGGFEATLSEVTFHVLFLKWTFQFSEIDDIQVETRYIIEPGRHSRHYFAEKITIFCGGKKRSFYGRMNCNVRSIINQVRSRMLNELCEPGQTSMTYSQRYKVERQLKQYDMKAEQLEHSRFLRLKKFIEENQKYL